MATHAAILRQLFEERSSVPFGPPPNVGNARYIPRATGESLGNWRVWDRQSQRFLTEREARLLGRRLLADTLVN